MRGLQCVGTTVGTEGQLGGSSDKVRVVAGADEMGGRVEGRGGSSGGRGEVGDGDRNGDRRGEVVGRGRGLGGHGEGRVLHADRVRHFLGLLEFDVGKVDLLGEGRDHGVSDLDGVVVDVVRRSSKA